MTKRLYVGLFFLIILISSNTLVGFKAYRLGANSVQVKWDKAEADRIKAIAVANEAILKQRPKVKHANQNRDHDALVRNGCKRGWVRNFENCPADSR